MQTQSLRVIGGKYRGRRLEFVSADGLRPTSDRVRETLFNWLQPVIAGARCLDLFAGSGLLGIEAASRGASEVVFIEQQHDVAQQLEKNINKLDLTGVQVIQGDAFSYLEKLDQKSFDIIFLDPPFNKGLLKKACEQLQNNKLLRPAARIYLESEQSIKPDELPSGWELMRSKQAGQVFYHLAITN